jgi:hypothetical protein
VRRHLVATYGLEDTEALLDDVFGAAEPDRRAGSL